MYLSALEAVSATLIKTTSNVIEGAEGFDGRAWALEFPRRPAGSRVASATGVDTFVVKVERGHNRVPAD